MGGAVLFRTTIKRERKMERIYWQPEMSALQYTLAQERDDPSVLSGPALTWLRLFS
jgi:hypothetical protein